MSLLEILPSAHHCLYCWQCRCLYKKYYHQLITVFSVDSVGVFDYHQFVAKGGLGGGGGNLGGQMLDE